MKRRAQRQRPRAEARNRPRRARFPPRRLSRCSCLSHGLPSQASPKRPERTRPKMFRRRRLGRRPRPAPKPPSPSLRAGPSRTARVPPAPPPLGEETSRGSPIVARSHPAAGPSPGAGLAIPHRPGRWRRRRSRKGPRPLLRRAALTTVPRPLASGAIVRRHEAGSQSGTDGRAGGPSPDWADPPAAPSAAGLSASGVPPLALVTLDRRSETRSLDAFGQPETEQFLTLVCQDMRSGVSNVAAGA